MSAIIEVNNKWMESQSHRVYPEVWNEDSEGIHWVAVPPEFESIVIQNAPYIDFTYDAETDTISNVVATERPPEPEPEFAPSMYDKLILSMIS